MAMTPRETVTAPVRAALLNAIAMHKNAVALGQATALPEAGLPETIGIRFATLMRAMNGKLVPSPSAQLIRVWYMRQGRFLPEIRAREAENV